MPIIAVVEVKPTQIGKGIGQCLAEMYATVIKFEQRKVYGIVTDGLCTGQNFQIVNQTPSLLTKQR